MSFDSTKNLAVVLTSGGMDSCVTAAIASQEFELAMLHLNYGQRTENRELKAFNDLSEYFKAKVKLILDTDLFRRIGNSSLTDYSIHVSEANLKSKEIPTSYVSFRNANILSMAVSWAETLGAKKIFIGAVEEDSSGYPDCRKVFYKQFNALIEVGTKPETKIEIITPLISMKKNEIIKKGIELNAPFHLTWSCYQSEEIACGVCDSCALRLRGFQQAGVDDPIPYKSKPNYL
ncbi:MAG: 7-cyano-7-deazaguanine synthase QueC [Ignavibacteria bacterium]|nr:7-cyano-7-deazaguanine synthase QueC [Ignavibacteria bacterium]